MQNTQRVMLELTRAEALVMFELLARSETGNISAQGEAERKVLWLVEGQLEKCLTEVLSPNYAELIRDARQQVVASTQR